MRERDEFIPRRRLTNGTLLARAIDALGREASSQVEVWQRLTESFAVDLDAVAVLVPHRGPAPIRLAARD